MANAVSSISIPMSTSFSYAENPRADTTRNYWRERSLDIKYPLVKTLKDTFLTSFKRPLVVLVRLAISMNPEIALGPIKSRFHLKEITVESIQKENIYKDLPNEISTPSDERLKYLLGRVGELAKKMGISKPIKIYTSNKLIPTGCVGGITSKPSHILFDLKVINSPDHQLDAVIAHELTHLKENHLFKHTMFDLTVLVIDVVFIVFVSPFAFFGVEAVASLTGRVYHRHCEQDCDNQAMKLLGTGKGLKEFFENAAQKALNVKNAKDFDSFVKQLDPRRAQKLRAKNKLTPEYMKKIQDAITPEGNNRRDFEHPPLTRRADIANRFLPQPV